MHMSKMLQNAHEQYLFFDILALVEYFHTSVNTRYEGYRWLYKLTGLLFAPMTDIDNILVSRFR